jgi:hypothetical protein
MGRGNNNIAAAATASGASLRGAGNDGEIRTLSEEHGVGSLEDMTAVSSAAAVAQTDTQTHRGDAKAIASFAKDLARSPKFSGRSAEELRDLAERLYAIAYQKAVTGKATSDEVAALAARRGESVPELQAELQAER